MEEIGPKIEEMQKKLEEHEVKMAEHEEKMKEHYSAAEETSVTEKAFSKAGLGSKPEGDILSFNNGNLKSMQYENILSRASKNNKK
jgi:ABC-type Fe3+-citrate transport system substrate-binding protein